MSDAQVASKQRALVAALLSAKLNVAQENSLDPDTGDAERERSESLASLSRFAALDLSQNRSGARTETPLFDTMRKRLSDTRPRDEKTRASTVRSAEQLHDRMESAEPEALFRELVIIASAEIASATPDNDASIESRCLAWTVRILRNRLRINRGGEANISLESVEKHLDDLRTDALDLYDAAAVEFVQSQLRKSLFVDLMHS